MLLLAANPYLGLICISYSFEKATDNPVGIKYDVFGFIIIGFLIKALRSIPEDKIVSNLGKGKSDSFTIGIVIILRFFKIKIRKVKF